MGKQQSASESFLEALAQITRTVKNHQKQDLREPSIQTIASLRFARNCSLKVFSPLYEPPRSRIFRMIVASAPA